MALNTLPNAGLTNRGYPSDRITTPILINGDMSVAQRGTSFTGQTSGAYYLDRFKTDMSSLGTWTITQSTDVPTGQGFAKSMKFDCTTADASPSANDFLFLNQPIEGFNTASFKFGSSNAESLTLSFWVKSNKTGTYVVRFYDIDNQRSISQSYTISSANTWEKKVIAISGDTVSSPNYDNGYAFAINWGLGAGSSYTSGTLNTSWNSNNNANAFVGQVNLADSTSNEWYVTGVQLEVGEFDSTSIPSFPFESYANNLSKCQRYYLHYLSGNNKLVGSGIAYSSNQANVPIHFPTTMRTSPSLDADTGTAYYRVLGSNSSGNGYVDDFNAFVIDRAHENATGLFINTSDGFSGTGGGGFYMITENSSASIAFDAEL
jgi:hypothetical protein